MAADELVDCRNRAAGTGLRIAPGQKMGIFTTRLRLGHRHLDGFSIARVDALCLDGLGHRAGDDRGIAFKRRKRLVDGAAGREHGNKHQTGHAGRRLEKSCLKPAAVPAYAGAEMRSSAMHVLPHAIRCSGDNPVCAFRVNEA